MSTTAHIVERFKQLRSAQKENGLQTMCQTAFDAFNELGIPTIRHEEWKYTRIGELFNKEYLLPVKTTLSQKELDTVRLPGHENANELVFVNGIFSFQLSTIRSPKQLVVMPMAEASASAYKDILSKHLGHSRSYLKDGINALNTAFASNGVFIMVQSGKVVELPIYMYHITDASNGNIFAQPRCLVHIAENASVRIVETYSALGSGESFTNQVMELVVERDAFVEYYKIQHDVSSNNQVSTTHIRQLEKSYTHTVTISLDGGLVRNNLNLVLDADYCEGHLFGLYWPKGRSHIDNHTLVDHVKPNCFSNELYKGIVDDHATGVFNGKIFVRPNAQKTNAYQSNKNILLSDAASINTKPQLEIFADDVKCSHGCTVGRLNEEGLFYLQSRGINVNIARSLLLHAFTADIVENIKLLPIRDYVEQLISKRLDFSIG